MQGVEKWAQVGVHLVLHISGQEAELFAGFDGRAHQNQPFRLVVLEHVHGDGDGEIGFARSGGARAEHQVVFTHRLHIATLPGGFGLDQLPGGVYVEGAGGFGVFGGGPADRLGDRLRGDRLIATQRPLQFLQNGGGLGDCLRPAGQANRALPRKDLDLKRLADHPQVLIARAEQESRLTRVFQWDTQFHAVIVKAPRAFVKLNLRREKRTRITRIKTDFMKGKKRAIWNRSPVPFL